MCWIEETPQMVVCKVKAEILNAKIDHINRIMDAIIFQKEIEIGAEKVKEEIRLLSEKYNPAINRT